MNPDCISLISILVLDLHLYAFDILPLHGPNVESLYERNYQINSVIVVDIMWIVMGRFYLCG